MFFSFFIWNWIFSPMTKIESISSMKLLLKVVTWSAIRFIVHHHKIDEDIKIRSRHRDSIEDWDNFIALLEMSFFFFEWVNNKSIQFIKFISVIESNMGWKALRVNDDNMQWLQNNHHSNWKRRKFEKEKRKKHTNENENENEWDRKNAMKWNPTETEIQW